MKPRPFKAWDKRSTGERWEVRERHEGAHVFLEAARVTMRAGGTFAEVRRAQVWPCWVQVTRVFPAMLATR